MGLCDGVFGDHAFLYNIFCCFAATLALLQHATLNPHSQLKMPFVSGT